MFFGYIIFRKRHIGFIITIKAILKFKFTDYCKMFQHRSYTINTRCRNEIELCVKINVFINMN